MFTVQIVEVDGSPLHAVTGKLAPEYEGLPEPFKVALYELMDNPEDSECANCNKPVGFVLGGEDPTYGESLVWRWATLVREAPADREVLDLLGKLTVMFTAPPVEVLCEDCSLNWVPSAGIDPESQPG